MGAAAESLTLDKDTPAKSAEGGVQQAGPASSAFDPIVQRLFGSAPSDPPASVADSLSIQRFRAPVLQRAQRLYGNRASQQIVMRAHTVQRQCACGGTCAKCQEEEQQRQIQRNSAAPAPTEFDSIPATVGEQLDTATRQPLEAHFGADLADVRVHTGSEAAKSATSIDALAYTSGRDIYFASGMYAPSSSSGRRLLAHEVAHVVQQSSGKEPAIATKSSHGAKIGAPDDPLETEADRAAEEFMTGPLTDEDERKKRESMSGMPSSTVQRFIQRQPAPASPAPASPAPATKSPPAASGPTMLFEDVLLATNDEYLDTVLRDYIAQHGEDKAKKFRFRLLVNVAPKVVDDPGPEPGAQKTGDPKSSQVEQPAEVRIARAVSNKFEDIFERNKQYLDSFEAKANEVVLGMLDESEERVRQEMIRYGISWKDVKYDWVRPSGRGGFVPTTRHETEYSMDDTPGSKALAGAATGILARKHKFDDADQALREYSDETGGALAAAFRQRPGWQNPEIENRLNELWAAQKLAKRDLDVFRSQKTAEFPILAAYATEENISEESLEKLQKLADGKNFQATNMIGEEIKSRLEHIAEVRKDILENHGKETKIWQVARIIDGTRGLMAATPGSMLGRLVDDKVKDEAPGILTSILIGLLQLVLVLLAPVTGGVTLIGAAAISVGQAYQHFREYERAQMLRGTDFGPMALSAEDPSLFWLAADIVGASFDLGAAGGAAVKIFEALAPAARAARAARIAKGAAAAEEEILALERAAGELGGAKLAEKVGQDARGLGEAAHIGETAEEAAAVDRIGQQMAETEGVAEAETAAGRLTQQEAREGVAEAESIAGSKVKVAESGTIWSCASPCTWFRERYRKLLARKNNPWEPQLKNLEDEANAAKDLKGAAGKATRQDIAKRTAALEREMRTSALPGEWTSPLKQTMGAEEFNSLVERRGSLAAELDHSPPDWTGADEARFRYGETAKGTDLKPEENYRWTLDQNGKLRYDRMDANLPPRQFNPATRMFEDASEAGLIRAEKGVEEAKDIAGIPKKQRELMVADFKKRASLVAERDRLKSLTNISAKDSEKLRTISAKINEQSRLFGEHAAEGVIKQPGGAKVYPLSKTYSTSGDFDQVWQVGDEFRLVEAKGGASGLGSRSIGEGVRAEQGTKEYALSIAQNMRTNGATREIRDLGRKMITAINDGKFKYILVRAPIGEEFGDTVVKVSEFVIK